MLFINEIAQSLATGMLPAFVSILFMIAAAISFAPRGFKRELLSHNLDGREMFVAGAVVSVIGLFVPDFAYAHALVLIGVGLMVLGGLIWLKDPITNKVLYPTVGLIYTLIAVYAFVSGAYARGPIAFNVRAFMLLCVPIFLASTHTVILVVGQLSDDFKNRVLPMDKSAWVLFGFGLAVFVAGAFAYSNIVLMIGAAAAGGLLFAFGGIVALNADWTAWLLQKKNGIFLVQLIVLYVLVSRFLF